MRHNAAERCVYGSNAKILPALFRSIANQYKYVCIDKECEKSHWNLAPFVNIYHCYVYAYAICTRLYVILRYAVESLHVSDLFFGGV